MIYLHDDHVAMKTKRAWKPGEIMQAENVEWPEVSPGDDIACGTCGHVFQSSELQSPFLVAVPVVG